MRGMSVANQWRGKQEKYLWLWLQSPHELPIANNLYFCFWLWWMLMLARARPMNHTSYERNLTYLENLYARFFNKFTLHRQKFPYYPVLKYEIFKYILFVYKKMVRKTIVLLSNISISLIDRKSYLQSNPLTKKTNKYRVWLE